MTLEDRYKNLALTCTNVSTPYTLYCRQLDKSGAQLYCISAKWHTANVAFHYHCLSTNFYSKEIWSNNTNTVQYCTTTGNSWNLWLSLFLSVL